MTYSITFSDGRKISGLYLIKDCFISETEIDKSIFDNNLRHVVIERDNDEDYNLDDENDNPIIYDDVSGEYEYMELESFSHINQDIIAYEIPGQEPVRQKEENWQFVIRELTEQERRDLTIDARLDYLEMMTGVVI